MSWFLIVAFAGSAQVLPVADRATCEELRGAVLSMYGRGSALVDVRCVVSPGDSFQPATPAKKR